MVLNIKNLFKKICVLGASATMALGLCAPLANADEPTNSTVGGKITTGEIKALNAGPTSGGGTGTLVPSVTVNSNAIYNYGQPVQLIAAASNSQTATALYLRAVKQGTDASSNIAWTKVWEDGNETNGKYNVTGTEAGMYDIYYYIDGKGNFEDVYTDIQQ